MSAAALFATLGLNAEGYNSGVQAVIGSTDSMTSALSGVGTIATGGMALAVGAVAGLSVAAFNTASDITNAENQIAASLGRTREEARGLTHEMSAVWATGIVENIDEAAAATIEVRQQMKILADDEIGGVTTAALKLQDTFESADLVSSTNAANVLMDAFGTTTEQSMDYLAHGFQVGLDTSGDFLDSIGEYGNLFATTGFSADQMFSIMQTGLAGGVLGTDKIADAIKEMKLRLDGGGKDVANAFAAMGLNYEEIATKVASGDATWADYFDKIVSGANSIESPIARATALTAVFGTQAEDLGDAFTVGLSASTTSLNDMSGSVEKLDIQYNGLGQVMTRLGRQGLLMVEPLRVGFLNLVTQSMPQIEIGMANLGLVFESFSVGNWTEGFGLIQTGFAGIVGYVQTALPAWMTTLSEWGTEAWGWIAPIIPQALTALGGWATQLSGFIVTQVPNFIGALAGFGLAAVQWIAPIIPPTIAFIGDWAMQLGGAVVAQLPGWIGALAGFGLAAVEWVAPMIPPALAQLGQWGGAIIAYAEGQLPIWINNLKLWGVAAYEWIADAIPPLLTEAGLWADSLLGYFSAELPSWVAGLLEWGEVAIEWISLSIPGLIIAAGEFIGALAEWAIGTALPAIAGFASEWAIAGYAWVRDELMPAIGPALWDFYGAAADTLFEIQGAFVVAAMEIGQGILTGVVTALEGGRGAIANKLNEIIQGAIDSAKAFFEIWSPSRVTAEQIGVPLGEGIVSGIESQEKPLSYAIESIIQGGIQEGMGAGYQAVVENAGLLGEGIVSGIESQEKPLSDAVENIIQGGIQEGMGAGYQFIFENATSLGEGIVSGVESQVDFSALVGSFGQASELIQNTSLPLEMERVLQDAFASMEGVLTNNSLSEDLPGFFENLFTKAGQTIGESDLPQSAKDVLYGTLMEAKEAALSSGFEGDLSTFFDNAFDEAGRAIQNTILPAEASKVVAETLNSIKEKLSSATTVTESSEVTGAIDAVEGIDQAIQGGASAVDNWAAFDPTGQAIKAEQAVNSISSVIDAGVAGATLWAESDMMLVEPVYLAGIASVNNVFESFEQSGLRWMEFDHDEVVGSAKRVFKAVDRIAKAAQDAAKKWQQSINSANSAMSPAATNATNTSNTTNSTAVNNSIVVHVASGDAQGVALGVEQGLGNALRSRGWV